MLGYLILLFIGLPIIELTILIKLGQYIGMWYTATLVILTGVVGAYLAKLEGLITLQNIQKDINMGKMPGDRVFDGFIILCSGLLLLTPGIITDIVGFLGLIPYIRELFKSWLRRKLQDMLNHGDTIRIIDIK